MAADSSDSDSSDNPLHSASSATEVDDEEDETYQPPAAQLVESSSDDEDMARPPAAKKMKSTLLHFYKGTKLPAVASSSLFIKVKKKIYLFYCPKHKSIDFVCQSVCVYVHTFYASSNKQISS